MTDDEQTLWEAEADKVGEQSYDDDAEETQWFTPPEGRTEVTFTGEYNEREEQKRFDEEPHTYVYFDILVDGEEYVWSMKKAYSENSKYGQIAKYAGAVGGLEDETVTWMRRGEGTDTVHVLLDLDDMDVVFEDDEE